MYPEWRIGSASLAVLGLLAVVPVSAEPFRGWPIDQYAGTTLWRVQFGVSRYYVPNLIFCSDEYSGHQVKNGQQTIEHASEIAANLVTWIIAKTGWTDSTALSIVAVPREQLVKMFSGEHSGANGIHIEAVYSVERHVIYLSKQWKPDNLRDRAVLLHELVHHLQTSNQVKATCPAEHEKQAYDLVFTWLRENGVDDAYGLLGVNEMFVRLLSHCPEF